MTNRRSKHGTAALTQQQCGLLGQYTLRPETANPKNLEKMADAILGLGQLGFRREFKTASTMNRIARNETYSKTGSQFPMRRQIDGSLSKCWTSYKNLAPFKPREAPVYECVTVYRRG